MEDRSQAPAGDSLTTSAAPPLFTATSLHHGCSFKALDGRQTKAGLGMPLAGCPQAGDLTARALVPAAVKWG